jgi:[calcium/calmodulin-dependent protein kinase] kinase
MNTLQQGCTFVNQYVVIKTLGQGAYGKVKLCLNTEDHNLYALKLVHKVGLVPSH